MTPANAYQLIEVGANALVAGSAVFGAKDYAEGGFEDHCTEACLNSSPSGCNLHDTLPSGAVISFRHCASLYIPFIGGIHGQLSFATLEYWHLQGCVACEWEVWGLCSVWPSYGQPGVLMRRLPCSHPWHQDQQGPIQWQGPCGSIDIQQESTTANEHQGRGKHRWTIREERWRCGHNVEHVACFLHTNECQGASWSIGGDG